MNLQPQPFLIDNNGTQDEFLFTFNDAIFSLSEPNPNASSIQNPYCNCCKEKYKSGKDIKYCQFCSQGFCPKCLFKTRVFPKSDEKDRGDVCKVCDRKFFIREMLQVKRVEIENNEIIMVGDLRNPGQGGQIKQISNAQTEINKIRQNYRKMREVYRIDYQKMQLLHTKLKEKITDLEKQQKRKQEENEKLIEQKQEKEDKSHQLT